MPLVRRRCTTELPPANQYSRPNSAHNGAGGAEWALTHPVRSDDHAIPRRESHVIAIGEAVADATISNPLLALLQLVQEHEVAGHCTSSQQSAAALASCAHDQDAPPWTLFLAAGSYRLHRGQCFAATRLRRQGTGGHDFPAASSAEENTFAASRHRRARFPRGK
jgi:hypothetical protein